ncbi:putative mitochondrial protein AtMg00860 [Nicotiana tabacum]|uniref:Mitochondrial protein AtMg00860 n=1 Tax=Nicotiana tabacum TaxID=4097 RepID=A0AC58ST45_TOBAC
MVISRAPQSPMKDPTAVAWNYNRILVTFKGKEVMGEVKEMNQSGKYDLKLNPAKRAFGVPSGKLMRFIASQRGIELDPIKIKSIRDLPPLKTKKEVTSPLGRLNYIRRFIAQLTTTCEPMFKLLKKDMEIKWTEECLEAFDKIKEYLLNPPVLVPPELEDLCSYI